MASDDFNKLHRLLLSVAETLLKDQGEFLPFGATVSSEGDERLVGAQGETEFPGAQALIDILVATFSAQAEAKDIRASGICLDTRFRPSTDAPTTDAVCSRLESASGECLAVYIPYTLSTGPEGVGYMVEFGDNVAMEGNAQIFLSR